MARKHPRPAALQQCLLVPFHQQCWECGKRLWVASSAVRTVTTLNGLCQLTLKIRRCQNPSCGRYHRSYRPEEEGHWALPHGEFGLDVIALIGALRYTHHRSIPEIHRELLTRSVLIAERTVTNLLARYEELVTLHLTDQTRLGHLLLAQGSVILALDGLQPDVGHEVLWVIRDCLSGEVLLARSLLCSSEADLAVLLREVQQSLPVPIRGVISDGQHSIRNAVQTVLPEIPYQLCHFHYLREAAKPIYEADRHAKKELKKKLRGIRPIERGLEKRADPEAQAIRGYCLAVRSALTDDGRPPLSASGLKLYERMTALLESLTRVAEKRGSLAGELERLQSMLTKGVTATSSLWADVQTGYHWVYRAAHILSNEEKLKGAQVRQRYERLLAEMADVSASSEALTTMLTTFRKVTASYWLGLFHCYDVPDLPRTNNGLEHYFGSARYYERRATGRKSASPGLVVRGPVRVIALVASCHHHFTSDDLRLTDISRWRTLRNELDYRQTIRRDRSRFRKSPEAYLATLEEMLLTERLPS
jgi:hypothetical protein